MPEENTTPEEWRPVVGYEGFYDVSDVGRVRSLDRIVAVDHASGPIRRRVSGRRLRQSNTRGYMVVTLSMDGKTTTLKVHRLVAAAFIGPVPTCLPYVLHYDGNPSNNLVANLRYGSPQDNVDDTMRHGNVPFGSNASCAKLDRVKVVEIRTRLGRGQSQGAIAAIFGLNQTAISQIARGKTWAWL